MKETNYDWNDVNCFSDWVERDLVGLLESKPDCVIGILNGGAVPALIVSNYFSVPLCWIQARSYEGKERKEVKLGYREYLENMRGKHIIIVDEVIDSGSTMKAVLEWLKGFSSKKISVVVMALKVKHEYDRPEFACFPMVIEPKETWITFPWEISKKEKV